MAEPGIANARWFGARGDGEQDDGPALIRASVSLCRAGRRGVLFIPEGTYYIPERLPVYRGVDVRGEGSGRTVLERRDDSGYLVAAGHLGAGHQGKLGVTFSDLTLNNTLRLVLCHGVSEISFRNVEFLNGFVRFECSEYITIDGCTFRGNIGKAAYASSECRFVRINNNTIRNAELGGLNLSGHRHSVVANNIIADARAEAMRLDRAHACLVVGNQLSATHAEHPALSLTSRSSGNRVLHNILNAPLGLVVDEAHQKANVLRGNVNVQETADAGDGPN